MTDFAPVYAVQTSPNTYAPRSEAMDTTNRPNLWSDQKAAQRYADRRNRRRQPGGFVAKVVTLRVQLAES